jgi:hypothetical protein
MKLADWLDAKDIGYAEMARLIGASNAAVVRRHALGERIPDREMMRRYYDATSGAVTANDFYGLGVKAGEAVEHGERVGEGAFEARVGAAGGVAAQGAGVDERVGHQPSPVTATQPRLGATVRRVHSERRGSSK